MTQFDEGWHKTAQGWEITAHHEIPGVWPEMIDWWWDNINNTERYQQWHPEAHKYFEWKVSPAENGHVGAVQLVAEELVPGAPAATFEIRWEAGVPAEFPAPTEYKHVLYATATGQKELAGIQARFLHEYEGVPHGTRMISHFWLPPLMPEIFVQALYEHNKQEMANFAQFLPDLFIGHSLQREPGSK